MAEKNLLEVAFIELHGRSGEKGAVQGSLEMTRVPYTGSGILAMNKIASRRIFQYNELPVPGHVVLTGGGGLDFPPPGERILAGASLKIPLRNR